MNDQCACSPDCTCGACRGIRDETPVEVVNRPGLSTVRYRVGDHGRFKESLLAGLSRARKPALRSLTTRRDDDFSVALLDAFAVVADILTFYQERIANESWLRTATERLSVGYLSRLIGYELRPGSAAQVSLAFQMTEGAGGVEKLTLSPGTRVQSTPGPDQKPQTLETVEEAEVRPAWNRIPARAVQEQPLGLDTRQVLLKGVSLNLRAGDGFLLVFPTSGAGDSTARFHRVASVEADAKGQWTRVGLSAALASAAFDNLTPPQTGAFVFRKQASLFGYNAPDFYESHRNDASPPSAGSDWTFAAGTNDADHLALDAVYREVVPGGWGVWESPGTMGSPVVFQNREAIEKGLAAYALSGKATRLWIQRGKSVSLSVAPGTFAQLRAVSVLVQSEKLALAEIPAAQPVGGDTVSFAHRVEGLTPGRTVAVRGNRLRAEVLQPVTLWLFTPSGVVQQGLPAGRRLDLFHFPFPVLEGAATFLWVVQDGLLGLVIALPGQVRSIDDEEAVELARITAVGADGKSVTVDPPLAHRYHPASVTVNANVARATHGETVKEEFEGGDGTQVFQRFVLKQPPLTYVPATTPSGALSTLRVWVDQVEWREVPFLYGRGPTERVFITRRDGEGKTWIQFGDGVTGARLPTGARNVRAEYRRGLGADGNLKAGQINLLVSRPLGLKDAVNPLPSLDGKDPEALEDARRNAPLTVLTLDRVVSLQDYEDFARAFAGVAKAAGTWSWFGHTRGVFLTVAGAAGGMVSREGRKNLRDAIAAWGDPYVPVRVENYAPAMFRTGLRIKADRDRQPAQVLQAVERALRDAFSFDRRAVGEDVSAAALAAAAQAVAGVVAVQVASLYRSGGPDPQAGLAAPLLARAPLPGERGEILAGEILTLDPTPLDLLEAMA